MNFAILITSLQCIKSFTAMIVEGTCDQDPNDICNSVGSVGVVANSTNLSKLVDLLKEKKVEKAFVYGFEEYVGPMVLYSNGALVPYIKERITSKYALCVGKCPCKPREVGTDEKKSCCIQKEEENKSCCSQKEEEKKSCCGQKEEEKKSCCSKKVEEKKSCCSQKEEEKSCCSQKVEEKLCCNIESSPKYPCGDYSADLTTETDRYVFINEDKYNNTIYSDEYINSQFSDCIDTIAYKTESQTKREIDNCIICPLITCEDLVEEVCHSPEPIVTTITKSNSKEFDYEMVEENEFVLVIKEEVSETVDRVTVINKNEKKLFDIPKKLYNPLFLYGLKKKLNEMYCQEVCLYINDDDMLFGGVNQNLYYIQTDLEGSSDEISMEKLNQDDIEKVCDMGLHDIKFTE